MQGFEFTPQQIQELKFQHRLLKNKKAAYRINAIYLLGTGWTQEKVCEALIMDEGTLRHYVKRYQEGGVKNLISNHYLGGQGKLTKDEELLLDQHLEQTLYLDAKSVADYIWKTFGEKYTVRGVTELLKRLNYVYKKPKVIPGKANTEMQKDFLTRYETLKNSLEPNDKILFMDGVHPQHNTIAAYGWIKKGQEKEIKSNTGRQRLNINGALELNTYKVTVTFEETLNAITVLALFKKLRKVYKKAGKLYVICDNAKYYKKDTVLLEAKNLNIELVFYCPIRLI